MKIRVVAIAVLIVLVLAGSGVWYLWSSTAGSAGPITIGITPFESSTLIYIAEDQGLFAQNGLDVTVRNYPTALAAVGGLLDNETDMAFAGEYVVVSKAFGNDDIRVIGSIARYSSLYLVGRKDRGIEDVSDLKGKTIGLNQRGPPEFYLGRFLFLNSLGTGDVTLVNAPTSRYVEAITNGSIDAIVVPSRYLDQINERLGDSIVVWPAQSGQAGYYTITCRDEWMAGHPEQVKSVLTALARAEEYANSHPDGAKAILQKKMNYTDDEVARIWPEHEFSLTLDLSLLTAMNDEARWMIAHNLTSETALPNFRDVVATEGLLAVKPSAVTIR